MPSSFEIDDRAFLAGLKDKIRRLTHNAERSVDDLAEETAQRMREDVAVETGETRDSIHVEKGQGAERIIHMGGASVFLEFGTSKMSPQPFARPALAEAPRKFRKPDYS